MNAAVMTHVMPASRTPAKEGVVSTRIDNEWITVATRPPCGLSALSPWEALLRNAELTGPAKLVLPPGGRDLEIRAELPVEDGVDVDAVLRQARDSLTRAAGSETPLGTDNAAIDLGPADLHVLAAEAGWLFTWRSSGRIAVELDVPGQFHRAIVEPRAAGCRARAALAVAAAPSAGPRLALAVLLLTVTGVVRMARAGATELDGDTTVFVEADLVERPSAWEFHHALSALTVACRMAGREAKALVDERVAGAYLAARGWAAQP
jgi:hypothetical protein